MTENAKIGTDAGNYGDEFQADLVADSAQAALDALLGVVGMVGAAGDSAKFAGLLAEPGLARTGAGALITDEPTLSYLFDTGLVHGELTSRVLQSAFASVVASAFKEVAQDIGVAEITDGLKQIASQQQGLSAVAASATQNSVLFQQSLQQRKQRLLSGGIPPLGADQQTAWANDLGLRGQMWLPLLNLLTQQDHFLRQFWAARAAASEDAIEWLLTKFAVQATATVFFDGPGDLATGGLFLAMDENQDLKSISSDGVGYNAAFSTIGGVIQHNNELFLNAASAYTEIAQGNLANPVTGQIGQMMDVTEGKEWNLLGLLPQFTVAKAYSLVDVRNTSPNDATFEVLVLWGYASEAYNLSIPNLAQVSIGTARIPAQTEAQIPITFLDGLHGAVPDAATLMTAFVVGNNESGTFYVGRLDHNWSPSQVVVAGQTEQGSRGVRPMGPTGSTNALPAVENPVSIYVTQNPADQTYLARLFVVNPFAQPYSVQVTQPLPAGLTVLTTEGMLTNSAIVWTNSIPAGGLVKDSFTFSLSVAPGAATNLPSASVIFVDSTNNTSDPLAADVPAFTGLFPVKVSAFVPLGTPGTNADMLVTVTNLTASSQTGTLTLTLTNATLAFGTNLAQSFTVAAAGASNLDFSLPGNLPAGQYAVTGLLSMNGGSGQVLADVYTMPARPFWLSLGPSPLWSTNGLSLALQGPVGSNYLIQVSTNLVNWTPIRYFGITNSPFYFNDATATNSAAQFYRAVIP